MSRSSSFFICLFALLSVVCFLLDPIAGQETSSSPSPLAASPSAVASPAASPEASPSTSPAASPAASPSSSPVRSSPSASPSPSLKDDNDTLVYAPAPEDDDDHWWDRVSNRMIIGLVVAFAVPAIVIGALIAAYVTYKAVQRRRYIETPAASSMPTRPDAFDSEMEQYPSPEAVFSIDDGEDNL